MNLAVTSGFGRPGPFSATFLAAATCFALLVATSLSRPVNAAGLLVADGGFGGELDIVEHEVRVTINNSIAVTQIDQVFLNKENRQVEALYTFPVPREASVSNFSMWIGGKEMIGEVVEKERAREIYQSYKRQRRDPGLLEQVDFKQFEMRIFPIPAGARQRIRIEYYQELNVDHDWATYVYPLATNVAGKPIDDKVQGRFALTIDVKSEVPIETFRSESHTDDFVVVHHRPDYAQAAMELVDGDLSRDIVLAVQMKRPRTGLDVVTSNPPGEDGYLMMTLTPGEDLSESMEPMDYVFLLDISGSMARADKLSISRQSVAAFIDSLGPEDRFECLAFNLAPVPLFQAMQPADASRLADAKDFLLAQRARGGTVLQPAITAAYSYRDDDRPLNVILLSDGMTEVGEQETLMRLIQARPDGVRVFCIGVGNEVNRPLLSQMAEHAGGLAAFVSSEDSFQRQAQLMRQKLVRPAIEDLSIEFAGSSVKDIEPKLLGDVFYGTPVRLLGRYDQGGRVAVTLSGTIQGGPWKQTVELELPQQDQGNSEIERMWAFKRVSRLLGQERAGQGSHRDEIVRLCEGYSIVSPYASMLVLENDAEYKRWKIEQRNATRISRDRRSRQRVQQQLAELRRQTERAFEVDRDQKLVSQRNPDSNPGDAVAMPDVTPSAESQPADPPPAADPSRNVDLNFTPVGGGAIEPFTALLTFGAIGAASMANRRRRTSSRA